MSRRQNRRQLRQARERRRRLAYATMIGGAALILVLIFLAVRSNQPSVEKLATSDTIALGQQVYEQNCAACHGPEGNGHAAVPEAPALNEREHAWHHPDGQIQQLILNGGQKMPAFGDKLSHDEIVAVVRYIQSWWTPQQLATQQSRSKDFPFTP